MNLGTLNFLASREHERELRHAAARNPSADDGSTPVSRVTLRYAGAADAGRLKALAELDSAVTPRAPVLVAEVDGRLRAALSLDRGARPIADPFHRGSELVELLRLRAAQLARAR